MIVFHRLVSFVLLTVALTAQKKESGIHLRHVPERGRVQHFLVTVTEDMESGSPGGPFVDSKNILALTARVEVLAVTKDDFTVSIRWVHVTGQMEIPLFGEVKWDSEFDTADASIAGSIRGPFLALAGTEFQARLKTTGEVIALPGVEASLAKTRKRIDEGRDPKMVDGIVHERWLRAQVQQLFPRYSQEPVAAEATWTGSSADALLFASGYPFRSKTSTRFAKTRGRSAVLIARSTECEMQSRKKPKLATRTYTANVNAGDGRVESSTMKIEVKTSRKKGFIRPAMDKRITHTCVVKRLRGYRPR